jgi:tRNA threonylcarbamoyladenosine biosynthesis protein TsaB
MKILSVDTSSNVASVAITDDEKLICEITVNTKKTHSQTIMPMIDSALKQSELEISDIDLIASANGPGSFTGLRIGVSAVKGLAHAAKIPVVGVSILEAMAYNLPFCEYVISPMMDARRQQVYNAVYEWKNEELSEIKAPRALSVDELIEELLTSDKRVVFLGDGVDVHKAYIQEKMGDKAVFAPVSAKEQRASGLAVAAKKKKAVSCYELAPIYLRKPQAERELEEKEKNKC